MTEKKVWTLKVDDELRGLIPPLSTEERKMLEESIVRDGCDTPLTVWEGTIVDGHNRYDICREHGIPFAIEERSFDNKEAVMFWMLEHQLARRNLEPYQRAEIMLKYAPILRKDAAQRQATSTGGSVPQLRPNLAEAERKPFTRDKLAKMAGVSHGTLDKVKKLDADADEATKEKLRAGEISMAGMMLMPIGRCRFNGCKTILERFPQNVGEAPGRPIAPGRMSVLSPTS